MDKIKYVFIIGLFLPMLLIGENSGGSKGEMETTTEQQDKDTLVVGASNHTLVIEQMNYNINALTRIINAPSLPTYEYEKNQLINNLTMTEIVGLEEVADFRTSLLATLGDLEMIEGDKKIFKKVSSIRKDNQKWEALSSALSVPMFATSGPQAAFYVLLTAARTYVDYNVSLDNMKSEEMQALWEIRKNELQNFNNLRVRAFKLVNQLYQKYNLRESDRLTEKTADLFKDIVLQPDVSKRIRLLIDNSPTFSHMAEYHYYLGMSYIDIKKYDKAKVYFDKYKQLYAKAPIFRQNEKLGTIALAEIAYNSKLTLEELDKIADTVLKNMPDNSAATLQLVLAYLKYDEKEKAFNILRKGLDNIKMTDKEILSYTAVQWLDEIKPYKNIYSAIVSILNTDKNLPLDQYILLLRKTSEDKMFMEKLSKLFIVDDNVGWLLSGTFLDKMFYVKDVRLNGTYSFDIGKMFSYSSKLKDNELDLVQNTLRYQSEIKREEILDDVEFIKNNPKFLPIFFYPIDTKREMYRVRKDVDYNKILGRDDNYQLYKDIGNSSIEGINDDELKELVEYGKSKIEEDNSIIEYSDKNGWSWWRKDKIEAKVASLDYLSPSNDSFIESVNLSDYNEYSNEDISINFVGQEIDFFPMWHTFEDGEYEQLYFKGDIPILLTYKKDDMSLYSVEIENKRYYANQIPKEKEDDSWPWYKWIFSPFILIFKLLYYGIYFIGNYIILGVIYVIWLMFDWLFDLFS